MSREVVNKTPFLNNKLKNKKITRLTYTVDKDHFMLHFFLLKPR